jgi:geranylgeranyl diphosphate synthase type I
VEVSDVLDAAGEVVPVMREAVGSLAPPLRRVCEYHLGWSDEEGRSVTAPAGKMVRPALALAGARAACVEREAGLVAGAAVELVHNFSLVHDDLMDGDAIRRHRPAVWVVFGPAKAVIAGDALAALAIRLLASTPMAGSPGAVESLVAATEAMIAGQAYDLSFENETEVSLARCLEMVRGKTGALLGCAASLGAALGGALCSIVEALRGFGENLGVAFQAVDDLLGIWGDPMKTGKPSGSDLVARKRSLPVVIGSEASGRCREAIARVYAKDEVSVADVEMLAGEIESCGARAATTELALSHLDAAVAVLDTVELDGKGRDELISLAGFIVGRDL